MQLPLVALDPNGKTVSVLVDSDGKVVTDQSPKPPVTFPATEKSIRVDDSGNLLIT